ncbi:MAG: 30S ribosomal protein S3 [Chloroflexi bacterium]|nr:30S ribosomal protein S3 [Chloroflexota bacterium]
MGRKVHPVGFRLKVNRDWDARWFAEGNKYAEMLHEDLRIRRFLSQEAERAAISRVEIERNSNQIIVTIHTARPGIVIGRKGDAVKKLRQDLETYTGKKVKVEVSEIDKPDLDAYLVAESIAGQLERRIGHSRAIKRAISQAMRQGAQGVKVVVAGRLAGADMARREAASEGRIPRSTLRANIDYATAEALTTFGRIGIKVWIYKGDVLQAEEKKVAEPKDVYVSP